MITTTTDGSAPITRADHPVDVNEPVIDLGDATVMTQGPSGGGTDGKRYLYQPLLGMAAQ